MRVLLVDDSRTMRKTLRRMLGEHGVDACEAGDGPEALARLERGERFDLMLVDLDMPVMNGLDLVRAVRCDPEWQALPIIVVTSGTDGATAARALMAGADDYLRTPLDGEVVAGKLAWLRTHADPPVDHGSHHETHDR